MPHPIPVLTPWDIEARPSPVGAPTDEIRFSGNTMPTPWPAAYGGDLCVGALAAAARTVEPARSVHSLNLNFLRPVDRNGALEYRVRPLRDGLTYATRAVSLWQDGTEMASATVSFRRPPKLERSDHGARSSLSEVPRPESLPTAAEAIAARGSFGLEDTLDEYWINGRGLDVRHVTAPSYGVAAGETGSTNALWVRLSPESAALASLRDAAWGGPALIAYLADDTILESALRARGVGWCTPGLFSTSIDQKIWFHAEAVPGDWLLFEQRMLSSAGSHVVCEGHLFRQDGTLVATVVQEGIVRTRKGARAPR